LRDPDFGDLRTIEGRPDAMPRRQHLTLTLVALMAFLGLTYFMSSSKSSDAYSPFSQTEHGSLTSSSDSSRNPAAGLSDSILKGGSIAPKLENATAK
jgi:hypothetical protein